MYIQIVIVNNSLNNTGIIKQRRLTSISSAGSKKIRLKEEEDKKQAEIAKKEETSKNVNTEKKIENKTEKKVEEKKTSNKPEYVPDIPKIVYKEVGGKRSTYNRDDKKMELNNKYIIEDKSGQHSLTMKGIRLKIDFRNLF